MDSKQNMYPSMPQPYPNDNNPQMGFNPPPQYSQQQQQFAQPQYGQPQYGGQYPQQPIQTQPQVVTTIISAPILGSESTRTKCPSCHADIATKVTYEASTKTHLFAVLLCLIFCPCVCLPYCCDSCQNANHYCPSCGSFIGTYQN